MGSSQRRKGEDRGNCGSYRTFSKLPEKFPEPKTKIIGETRVYMESREDKQLVRLKFIVRRESNNSPCYSRVFLFD